MALFAIRAQNETTQRRTGSTTMPDPRSTRAAWIGGWGGVFGGMIYNLAQTAEMLPINRLLLGINSTLLLMWFLALLSDDRGGRS